MKNCVHYCGLVTFTEEIFMGNFVFYAVIKYMIIDLSNFSYYA